MSAAKQLLLQSRLKGARPASQLAQTTIPRRNTGTPAPLSFAQRQMWWIDQVTPGNPACNLPVAYHIHGDLDIPALEAAFTAIIKRHEILRTTFLACDGAQVQVVQPPWELEIERMDLRALPPDERRITLQELGTKAARQPFILTQLPLLRVMCCQSEPAVHTLFITLHHIIADGISVTLLFNELDACYRAAQHGNAQILPDLAIQYSDFATWEQDSPRRNHLPGQLEFWTQHLQGTLPLLDLPLDKPRPPVQSFEGSNVFTEIPAALVRQLQAVASRHNATLFALLLAAYEILLHRHSGATDFIVGVPAANRSAAEMQSMIGNFLNMLALRADLSGDPTFDTFLRETRERVLNAFSNEVPFEHVIEKLQFARDPARNPVFQTILQVLPDSNVRLGDLELEPFQFDLGFAQFDLSLHLYRHGSGYHGRFEYCTGLFERETIGRLAEHFLNLLNAIAATPDLPVSQLSILSDHERAQIFEHWNKTSREYPRDRCVHSLFEEAARANANRTAVEFGNDTLSYGELNARANDLARRMIESGAGPGHRVGLFAERSLDLVVGLLGILKSGAGYVPMDPALPADRLRYMMDDASIATVVTQAVLANSLPEERCSQVVLNSKASIASDLPNPTAAVSPSSLAYAIYTSGSTGQPKGVTISHQSVVNFLSAMQHEPGFGLEDVLVAVTTISFDIAVLELLLPLISGGKVVIADRDTTLDGRRLLDLLKRTGATVLQATPATWKLLLQAGWTQTPKLRMFCGGELLTRELADQMLERGAELWNMYGPTETTVWSSIRKISKNDRAVLLGPPIANTTFYVVDANLSLVPIGVEGELLIGGVGVSQGYINKPELTAERFVPDPFEPSRGRVYRTGDRVRWHPDGSLEFLGRADHQVKVRGHRIEPGEIESRLRSHPDVQDAVVLVKDDESGERHLTAYVIPAAEQQLKPESVKAFLREALPDYMIPAFVIEMAEFPLTPNRKVNHNAFPSLKPIPLTAPAGNASPRDELEARLAAIWKKILKIPAIDMEANFFELGGHSLLAAFLFAQIERELGVALPLATLLQASSVRKLAKRIRDKSWEPGWRSLVPLRTSGDRPPLFLVHGAEGNILLYSRLTEALPESQPVYGLQARGLDGRESPEATIKGMAEKYLAEIHSVQPDGPYLLGGYCLGGLIALEMAVQLHRMGQQTSMLALIETYNVSTDAARLSILLRTIHKLQNLGYQSRNVILSCRMRNISYLREKLQTELSRCRLELELLRHRAFRALGLDASHKLQHLKIQEINHSAQSSYRPPLYPGTITLFRPLQHFLGFEDPLFGWGHVAKQGVRVISLPNSPRGSLNDPFVNALARHLTLEIEKATGQENSGPRDLREINPSA